MLGAKQAQIALPIVARRKPVAAFARKRSALLAGELAPHRVFPIRAVHRELPYVVAVGRRTPERRLRCHAAQRSAQVSAVPGFALVRVIENPEEQTAIGHASIIICSLTKRS